MRVTNNKAHCTKSPSSLLSWRCVLCANVYALRQTKQVPCHSMKRAIPIISHTT